ncbi:MAG: tetratricopeptide repeat protein [Bacteroidota bacterium]
MRRLPALLAVLVLGSALAGCSRIFGQRYDNFTSYYNTFYNAKIEFNREEEQLLKAETRVDRERYLALFYEPREGGEQRAGFEKSIEKGADLLREHPNSKWVDDALLLIGKARFYQGDWSGAEEKFREVIEAGEPKLVDEAWFWLGRTLVAAEQYEDAALALREGLDRSDVREVWAARMRLALAETDVRAGNWIEAVTSLREGIVGIRDRELTARAEFLLGQVYETIDEPAEAAAAYRRALDTRPRYELAYAAGVSEAVARSQSGEGDEALRLLRQMGRDDKNFENRGEIEMKRAQVLAAVGRPGDARDLLLDLLYDPDPTMQMGSIRGPVHYRLAGVYRDGLTDYISAAAHYDTAATTIREVSLAEERTTPQAITDATLLADAFGAYAGVAGEIAEMDSLLYLGGLNDEDFDAAIAQIRAQREREARERERDLARRRSEQGFGGVPVGGIGGRPEDDAGGGGATGGAGTVGGDFGFLDYRNPVRVQEELIAFQGRWGEVPYAPNWRRAQAVTAAAGVARNLDETLGGTPDAQAQSLARETFVDVSAVPRTDAAQRIMRADRAAARFELGNTLFLSLSRPDSAIVLYRSALGEDADPAVAQRAYFALAEAERVLGNDAEAERLYSDILARYPDSRFAEQARAQLGLAPADQGLAVDSLSLAEAAYDAAFATWQTGAHEQALDQMLTLSNRYANTPVAARARLAAGAVYTEWAAGDEETLLAPTPALASAIDEALLFLPPPDTTRVPAEAPDEGGEEMQEDTEAAEDEAPADPFGEGLFEDAEGVVVDSAGTLIFPAESADIDPETLGPDPLELPSGVEGDPASFDPAALDPAAFDPMATGADSVVTTTDSTLAAADSTGGPPAEPENAAPDEDPWLDVLYASIESDFPGTPYAERAQALRGALDSLRPDRVAAAGSAAADSLAADGSDLAAGAPDDPALRGDDPIQHRKGAYAWLLMESSDRTEAEGALASVFFQGYRAAINTVVDASEREDNVTYQVLVGLFSTEAEAEAARAALPERVPTVGGVADPEAYAPYRLGPGRGAIEQASDIFGSGDQ